MSSNEIKELKAITLQILKNQTLMIAHLVNQAQQNQTQLQLPTLPLKQIKAEPRELPSMVLKRKATPVKQPLKELNNNSTVIKRTRASGNSTAVTTIKQTKFCSICAVVVNDGCLVNHIWEHILKKVVKGKGADLSNAFSFVCDVDGCRFRTNKLDEAGGHASKHPDVERNKVVLDNRENSEPLFVATLAQCYDRMSDSEKDEVYRKRHD